MDNISLLKTIFKKNFKTAHVTFFMDDPNNIPTDRRGLCWMGAHIGERILPASNQYYCVSQFELFEGRQVRRKAQFKAMYIVVADDVREKLPIELVEKLPTPTYKLLTSQNSEQWGWVLTEPISDRSIAENLLDGLVKRGLAPDGKDPGMKGVTRYVRLPDGYNSKSNRLINGNPFECEMVEFNYLQAVDYQDIASPFDIDVHAVRRDSRVVGATSIKDHPIFEHLTITSEVSPGRVNITCPWVNEHTNERNDGSAVFTNEDGSIGFKCHHGHCEDRTARHVMDKIEEDNPGWKSKFGMWKIDRFLKNSGDLLIGAPTSPVMQQHAPTPPVKMIDRSDKFIDLNDIKPTRLPIEFKKLNNHNEIVDKMLINYFQGRLLRVGNIMRWWSGREWQCVSEDMLKRIIMQTFPTDSISNYTKISSIYKMLLLESPYVDSPLPCKRIFFKNGVLNSVTRSFEPHKRENYNTGTLSVNHGEIGTTVEWKKFLISIFGSIEDDRVKLLQEMLGYFLIGHNLGIEKYMALIGATRAGKSVILKVLEDILGKDFCGSFNFNTIGSVQGHAALWEYRVVIDSDAKLPRRDDRVQASATIQKVTSNETISSRRFHKNEPWVGKVHCKIFIGANDVLIFPDDSGASASRMNILKLDKSFLGKEDKHLFGRLSKELPGIAQWSLEGLYRLLENDGVFTEPDSSKEEMNDLKYMSKPLSRFIEDYLVFDPNSKVSSADLYNAFKIYAGMNNFPSWGSDLFMKRLKNTLLEKDVERGRFMFNGCQARGFKGMKIVSLASMPGVPLLPTPMLQQAPEAPVPQFKMAPMKE